MAKFKIVKQMSVEEIRSILHMPNYEMPIEFLTQNKHLGKNIALLGLGGSISYGTNRPGKGDVDIRGMFLEQPHEIIGMIPNPEQAEDSDSDTVIYSFNKLFELLLDCNPNTIQLLGLKHEHYFFINELGQRLLDDRQMFLSKRAITKFMGYANQQLNRLENAIARDRLTEEKKAEHVRASMENVMMHFEERTNLSQYGTGKVYTGKEPDGSSGIYLDIDIRRFPVKSFNGLMNELTGVYRSYNKLNHRNNKKDEEHLNKHAMMLLLLYYMGLDILEKQEIKTFRDKEHDLFMFVRNGGFMLEDGSYSDAFYDLRRELQVKFDYAAKHTELPAVPNPEWANEFKFEVNKRIIELA